MTEIGEYFKELESDVRRLREMGLLDKVEALVNVFYRHYKDNNKLTSSHRNVYAFGNGGSAANASHFAAHFSEDIFPKGKRKFTVVSLVDNIPRFSAKSNDFGYDVSFKDYLEDRILSHDIVVAFSGSGSSPNVVKAAKYAKEKRAFVIGFTGDYKGGKGGDLAKLSDLPIVVPTQSMERIEDIHSALYHAAKDRLYKKISEEE